MEADYDAVILSRVGLSEEEATDFIAKHQAYLNSLSPCEYDLAFRTLPSWEEAANAIHPEVTAEVLQDFVARRGQTPAPASAFSFGWPIP